MDQVKIGKFIAHCRKEKNMTQAELAEKLNITDRAISKWETGKGMPDSSIMLELCDELDISVNELLSGEMIRMDNYNKVAEENFINSLLIEQKAGYYQCDNCKYKYIPSYKQVLFAMHSGRTRYMKCPKCHKRTWNKKVID